MKKFILSFVVLLSMSCNAANWVAQGASTDSIAASYVDTSSLLWTDHSYTTRSAWVKTIDRKGFSIISRFFAHCPSRMYVITEHNYYDSNGSAINAYYTGNTWDYTMPNSMSEKWARTICTSNATTR